MNTAYTEPLRERELIEQRNRVESRAARLRRFAPDLRDAVFLAGLGMLGFGLWLERPAAAYIVVGAVLLAVALRRPPMQQANTVRTK